MALVLGEKLEVFLAEGEGLGGDTLPDPSSDITARLALWELSERSLRLSFLSLCDSLPLSFASFTFSSDFSLFLCFPLCFFPTTGRSKGTGGGGLGVRGPFFLLWPPLDDLSGEDTDIFFSFLVEPGVLAPPLCLGEPLDFLEEGESLELIGSGEACLLTAATRVLGSSFLMRRSSRLSWFSCSSFSSSL